MAQVKLVVATSGYCDGYWSSALPTPSHEEAELDEELLKILEEKTWQT